MEIKRTIAKIILKGQIFLLFIDLVSHLQNNKFHYMYKIHFAGLHTIPVIGSTSQVERNPLTGPIYFFNLIFTW